MRCSIAFVLVLWFGLVHLARAQELKTSQPIAPFDRVVAADLVDQVRRSGWQAVMSVVAKLEAADKEKYPGVIAFAADIRTFENVEDRTKAPRDWSPVDADELLLRNPNFWRAIYEVAPGDSAMTLAHIGMRAAMGEIDLAHNLIHLSNQDDAIPSANRKTLGGIDVQIHKLLVMVSGKIKQGNDRYDSKEIEAAIKEYQAVLEVWPKCAAASYELAQSLRDKRAASDEVERAYTQSRHSDPLLGIAYQGKYKAGETASWSKMQGLTALWKQRLRPTIFAKDEVLLDFAKQCQDMASREVRLNELALFARQIVIGRKGGYDASDQDSIAVSLKQLISGNTAEEISASLTQAKPQRLEIFARENSREILVKPKPIPYGKELLTIPDVYGKDDMCRLAYSPDGSRIATASDGGEIQIWDSATGKKLFSLQGHQGTKDRTAIDFSSDGKMLASIGSTGVVKLWNIEGSLKKSWRIGSVESEKTRIVSSIAFTSNNERLLTCVPGHGLKIWEIESEKTVLESSGSLAAISQDGKFVAVANDQGVDLLDAESGQIIRTLKVPYTTMSIAFSPDGSKLVAGSNQFQVTVWNVVSGSSIKLREAASHIRDVAFSPDGRYIACGSIWVVIHDAKTGRQSLILQGHRGMISSLAFSPDGKCLASSALDNTVKVWDLSPLNAAP